MGTETLMYSGIALCAIVGICAIAVMIAMCACSRKVIEDKSSSDDLATLFPEVNASKDDNKDI